MIYDRHRNPNINIKEIIWLDNQLGWLSQHRRNQHHHRHRPWPWTTIMIKVTIMFDGYYGQQCSSLKPWNSQELSILVNHHFHRSDHPHHQMHFDLCRSEIEWILELRLVRNCLNPRWLQSRGELHFHLLYHLADHFLFKDLEKSSVIAVAWVVIIIVVTFASTVHSRI